MKLILVLFFILIVSCACQPPQDPTPKWDQNNRYGLEMQNNCNLDTHSIGLNGCAFVGTISPTASLILPPLWSGTLKFESTECGEYTYSASSGNANTILLKDIYGNTTYNNCSFTITRVARVGNHNLDDTIMGRFFIKMLPNNPYFSLLQMSISDETVTSTFNGAAWFQKRYKQVEPAITFYPKGKHGTFIMYCGTTLIKQQDYDTSPFTIQFSNLDDCDYEVSAINMDNPAIEYGSYMHETNGYTESITVPSVSVTKVLHYVTFEFADSDVTGKKHAVVGVEVNGKQFSSYKAMVKGGLPSYVVKGVTMGGRYFVGTYTAATKTWNIIN